VIFVAADRRIRDHLEQPDVASDCILEGVAMSFGSAISLIMTLLAIVSVFIFIPLVSEYAFWIAVAAYIILASTWHRYYWS
jgi:hypothetical protein